MAPIMHNKSGRLSDDFIAQLLPRDRPYKLADGQSMHLLVSTTGARLWRMRYVIDGKEKTLAFGQYPAVTLAEARAMRDRAKAELKAGRNPSFWLNAHRAGARAADHRFETIARDWFETNKRAWSTRHASDVLTSLERDVFPAMGRMGVSDIRAPHILATLRRIEDRPAIETAHRVGQIISAVLDFAAASGIIDANPTSRVRRALKPIRKGRRPAVLSIEEARQMLRDVEASRARPITKLALRFLALTVLRPGVIASTPWTEISGLSPDAPIWRVPASRMKLRVDQKADRARDHMVPLSRHAVELIATMSRLTGRGPLVFPALARAHPCGADGRHTGGHQGGPDDPPDSYRAQARDAEADPRGRSRSYARLCDQAAA